MAQKGFMNLPLALGMGILGGLRPSRAPQNFFTSIGPGLAQGLQMYAASQPKPQSELDKLRIAQIRAQMAASANKAERTKAYLQSLPEQERSLAQAMGVQNYAQSVMDSRKPPKAGKTQMLPISDTHSQLHQVGPDGIPVPVPNAPIVRRSSSDLGKQLGLALTQSAQQTREMLQKQRQVAAAKQQGKESSAAIEEVRKQGVSAAKVLRNLVQLQDLGEKLKTGADVGVRSTIDRLARAVNLEFESLGNAAALKQAYDALTYQFVTEALGSGQFPSNNFSNADLTFLKRLNPNSYNEPEANKIIIDSAIKVYGYSAKRMEFFNRKIAEAGNALKPIPLYSEIENEWQTSESNPLRRDVINAANALGDNGYVLFKDEKEKLDRLQSTSGADSNAAPQSVNLNAVTLGDFKKLSEDKQEKILQTLDPKEREALQRALQKR